MTKKVIFNVILKKNLASLFSLSVQANVLVSGAVTQNQTLDCFAFKKICKATRIIKTRLAIGTYRSFQFRPEVVTLALKISRIRNSLMEKKNDY